MLNYYTYELVKALTHKEDEKTLDALKLNLIGKPQYFVNDIVIIKIADRTDNLNTRVKEGRLKKKYIKKSAKLIQHLYDIYKGDKQNLKDFIENNILSIVPELKDKLVLDSSLVDMDIIEPSIN